MKFKSKQLVCQCCNKAFLRPIWRQKENYKSGFKNIYCSKKCEAKYKTIDKQNITDYIKNYYIKHNKIIGYEEWTKRTDTPCCYSTVTRLFGTYKKACLKAIGICQQNKYPKKYTKVKCNYCNKSFIKQTRYLERSPYNFCNSSHSLLWKVKSGKIKNRSKLETYLYNRLKKEFTNLTIINNDLNAIGYELDIFIPNLKLAIEVNGIHHYKPIYGEETLRKKKAIDKKKYYLCRKNNIKLINLNISKYNHLYKDVLELVYSKLKNKINKYINPS